MVATQAATRLLACLLLGKALFDQIPIVNALASLALAQLAAAALVLALKLDGRQLHVELDLVVEAQIAVDVCRSYAAGIDGSDDGGGTGLAVAAAKEAIEVGHGAVRIGDHAAPLAGDAHLLKRLGIDVLADGHEHALAGNDALGRRGGTRGRTTATGLADNLRLHAQAAHATVLARLDGERGRQLQHLAALGLGTGNLGVLSRHIADAAAVDDAYLFGTAAHGRARHVHGHVAAADDAHALAAQVGQLVVADGTQHLDGRLHAGSLFARKAELLIAVGTNGQIDGIELVAQAGKLLAVHGVVELNVDAGAQDPVDLGLQTLARQTIAGDAVAQHAAQVVTLLKDGHLMTHHGQVVSAGKAGRAAADHGDALTGVVHYMRFVVVEVAVLNGKTLEGEDVHGVVDHATATVHLAGMLAHQAADERQRVILADDLDGIGIAAGLDERNVPGNVDVRWAARDARDAGLAVKAAGVLADVMLKIVAETADSRKRHGTGLVTDGAIARKIDGAGRALDQIERGLVGAALEHIGEQVAQRAQAHAAGRTLAAALGGAQVDERRRKLDGARGERTHRQTTSECIVQVVHDGLSVAAFHYVQSSHKIPSHAAARRRGRAKLLHATD